MVEVHITHACVVQDEVTKDTVLMGVAERHDDVVNFKASFVWEELDKDLFIQELRETLAKEFDCPTYHVDLPREQIFKRMEYFARQVRLQN